MLTATCRGGGGENGGEAVDINTDQLQPGPISAWMVLMPQLTGEYAVMSNLLPKLIHHLSFGLCKRDSWGG